MPYIAAFKAASAINTLGIRKIAALTRYSRKISNATHLL